MNIKKDWDTPLPVWAKQLLDEQPEPTREQIESYSYIPEVMMEKPQSAWSPHAVFSKAGELIEKTLSMIQESVEEVCIPPLSQALTRGTETPPMPRENEAIPKTTVVHRHAGARIEFTCLADPRGQLILEIDLRHDDESRRPIRPFTLTVRDENGAKLDGPREVGDLDTGVAYPGPSGKFRFEITWAECPQPHSVDMEFK